MNRWHAAIFPLAALAAYVTMAAFSDVCSTPWGHDVVFAWWHARTAVVTGCVTAIVYCAARARRP